MNRIEAQPNGDRHLRTLLILGAVGQRGDAELLARFVAGSGGGDDAAELAFAALVDRHGPTVLRVARTILGDEATSLDAFQATFLILAQKARSLRVGDSLAPWLATVARRVALGARKARARRHRLEQAAARPEALTEPPSHVWGETLRAVLAEVDRLPEPYRAAVVACHLDGLTQRQAADRLHCPIGTLQSRLDRGRRKLRDRLTRQGLAPSALALLPPSGLSVSLPPGLAATLAQIATGWAIRSTTPPLIAPGVLAALHAAAKGTSVTKLAPLALALLATAGLAIAGGRFAIGPDKARRPTLLAQATSPGDTKAATTLIDKPTETLKDAVEPGTATKLDAGQSHAIPFPEAVAPLPTLPDDGIPLPQGAPTLLFFHAAYAEPSRTMATRVAALGAAGYPVRTVDINHDKRFEANYYQGYKAHLAPVYFVVTTSGEALARADGVMSTKALADFYNQHRTKAIAFAPPQNLEIPFAVPPPIPRPWETTVRIKVQFSESQWGFGSGIIVASNKQESIVLTSTHHFHPATNGPPALPDPLPPIKLDLCGRVVDSSTNHLHPLDRDLPAEIVAINFGHNFALLKFRPERVLPAAPIAQAGWKMAKGMQLITTACSEGNDVFADNTVVLETDTSMSINGLLAQNLTRCGNLPARERSGGGLFTPEGYLVGLCAYADPSKNFGVYLSLDLLWRLVKSPRPGEVEPQFLVDQIAADLSGTQIQFAKVATPMVPQSSTEAGTVPRTDVSTQQQRLDDLERKLDRVLQNLDNIRGELGPKRPDGLLRP